MTFAIDTAYGFGLLLLRTSGLFATAPVLSARTVPVPVRLGFALLVSFAVFAGAGSPRVPPPAALWPLAAAAAGETACGLLAGLSARWILESAAAAGQLAGLPVGLGFGAMIDGTSGAESSALGELLLNLAQAGAVAAGIHREAIAWLARSARAFPPGGDLGLAALAGRALGQAAESAGLAVRLAFPVLGAATLGHLVLGVLGRSAPQLNLGTIGFSVVVLGGGLALYLVAPAAAEIAARSAAALFDG